MGFKIKRRSKKRSEPMNLEMAHLDGFWDDENWSDEKAEEYKRRHDRFGAEIKEWFDQAGHRHMGRTMSREEWEAREAAQWPSGTGSFDALVDHLHWLKGAGLKKEMKALKKLAKQKRPDIKKIVKFP